MRTRLHLESLEPRRLLAAAVFAEGVVSITGTESADQLRIYIQADQLIIEGASFQVEAALVERLEATLLGGNDRVTNDTSIALIAHGGDGNDELNGGSGDDQLFGDGGVDQLLGRGGSDVLTSGGQLGDLLDGGDGADLLEGTPRLDRIAWSNPVLQLYGTAEDDSLVVYRVDQSWVIGGVTLPWQSDNLAVYGLGGNDRLVNMSSFGVRLDGGEGDDRIVGGKGDDRIIGGAGSDTLHDRGGNDAYELLAVTGGTERDRIFDGAGVDRLTFVTITADTTVSFTGSRGNLSHAGRHLLYIGSTLEYINAGLGNDTITAQQGALEVYGGGGNDRLHAGSTGVRLYGGDGRDFLYGGPANDQLDGGAGDDYLYGGAGDDTLNGNEGLDLLRGEEGDDDLFGGNGQDNLDGGLGDDEYFGGAGRDAYHFDSAAEHETDTISDNDAENYLSSFNGVNVDLNLTSNFHQSAERTIHRDAGAGFQYFSASRGVIKVRGTEGPDKIFVSGIVTMGYASYADVDGGGGDDYIDIYHGIARGGSGNDRILGNGTNIELYGDDGNDILTGGLNDDIIHGGAGDDQIIGRHGRDTLHGDDGNDSIRGDDVYINTDSPISYDESSYRDWISGGNGNDVLEGDIGDDRLDGGEGNDFIVGGWDSDELFGGAGNDTLLGGGVNGYFDVDRKDGKSLDKGDILHGEAGDDSLNGGLGNDALNGSEGNDRLAGGYGDDEYLGGSGDDTYRLDPLGSQPESEKFVDEDRNNILSVFDDLNVDLNHALPFSQLAGRQIQVSPNLGFSGFASSTAKVRLFGTDQPDVLRILSIDAGKLGSIEVDGRGGDDQLETALMGIVRGGDGNDTIFASPFNDTVYGGAGDDYIAGGMGTDYIYGGLGNDVIRGDRDYTRAPDPEYNSDTFPDYLYGEDGNDIIGGEEGRDHLFGGSGDDILFGGWHDDQLYGEGGNDTLYGGESAELNALIGAIFWATAPLDGNDRLSGGADNDVLTGDHGADTLLGDEGDDTFDFDEQDTVVP